MAMLKLGTWLFPPLLCLPLCAQEAQVLPNEGALPPVDSITPVPAPSIPLGGPVGAAPSIPKELNINNQGGAITGDLQTGILNLGGPIKITGDSGLEIFADTAQLDTQEKKVVLNGNVSVYQGDLFQRGDRAVYYYERKFLDSEGLRASVNPVLLEAGKFTAENRNGKQVLVGYDAGVTTHDVEDPNYWVRSKKTTVYPGEKIVFENLRLYAGDTPVFWLPYLSQPLDGELGYHLVPGMRSNWGPYLLNTYGLMLGGERDPVTGDAKDAWILSRWHVDLRGRRGVGTGVDLVDSRIANRDEISGFSAYYLNDLAPSTRRSGVPRGFVNEDRFKLEWKNRQLLDFQDDAEWHFDTNLTYLSDQHYLEDFETERYRRDPAPDNTLGLYRRDDVSLLSLMARVRPNDFYRADTRLPEIAYDQARRPLFGLPLLHEGNTSFGIIGEKAADATTNAIINPLLGMTASNPAAQPLLRQLSGYDRQLAEQILALPLGDPRREAIRTQLVDAGYSRFNTYHEFSLPTTLGGFLNLTPEAGFGYTRYDSVDGPVDGSDRTYLHAGTEASMKFFKDYDSYQNPQWGANGLKHVLQPYVKWSVISSNDLDPSGPRVDRLTPTTRPRPLDPTRFTAVDELQSWNVLRLGTRNRLLTKRDRQSFEWLYLDTYMDAFLTDPEGSRNFSNLYNDVRWAPVPWMQLGVETQVPITSQSASFSEFNTNVRFVPNQSWEFSLNYRMLNSHPVLTDSNRIDLRVYTRLSENWGLGSTHGFEMDDGTLELEQYTLHRDLGNWVAGVGLTHRDNRLEEEYGIVFSLTLKDFPSASLPFRIDAQ